MFEYIGDKSYESIIDCNPVSFIFRVSEDSVLFVLYVYWAKLYICEVNGCW